MNVDLPEETVEKLTQIKQRQDLESLEEAIDYAVAEANESSEGESEDVTRTEVLKKALEKNPELHRILEVSNDECSECGTTVDAKKQLTYCPKCGVTL